MMSRLKQVFRRCFKCTVILTLYKYCHQYNPHLQVRESRSLIVQVNNGESEMCLEEDTKLSFEHEHLHSSDKWRRDRKI